MEGRERFRSTLGHPQLQVISDLSLETLRAIFRISAPLGIFSSGASLE